jgi:hypothetical protein
MHRRGLPMPLDWPLNQFRQWRETGLPPAHLLRAVFDECATYAEARERLTQELICMLAIFTLAGVEKGEGCVIERLEHAAETHEAPVCAANHWQSAAFSGSASRSNNESRLAAMAERFRTPKGGPDFAWLTPPILNETTRLAVSANPAKGTLHVQGLEVAGTVTRWTAVAA